MRTRYAAGLAAIVLVAVIAGFAACMGVITALNAVLPPFREEVDDDTMREFLPVAMAFLTGFGTSIVVLFVGLRRLNRPR